MLYLQHTVRNGILPIQLKSLVYSSLIMSPFFLSCKRVIILNLVLIVPMNISKLCDGTVLWIVFILHSSCFIMTVGFILVDTNSSSLFMFSTDSVLFSDYTTMYVSHVGRHLLCFLYLAFTISATTGFLYFCLICYFKYKTE